MGNEGNLYISFPGGYHISMANYVFIFKIGALGYESVLDYVLFLSFTASGDAILFINPPIFSLIYILVETTRRKILNIMNIFLMTLYIGVTYSICWLVFMHAAFTASGLRTSMVPKPRLLSRGIH